MNTLPGYVATPGGRRSTAWLLVLALVGAVLFVMIKYAGIDLPRARPDNTKPAAALAIPTAETEDLQRHLDSAATALENAAAAMNKSQLGIDRAMTTPDYNPVAERRLQLARAAQGSAATEIIRAREELEIVKNIITERSTTK